MDRIIETLLLVGALGLLLGSLLMLIGGSISLIEVTTNFRPHVFVAGTVLVVVAAIIHRPAAVIGLVALLVLAPATLPHLVPTGSRQTVGSEQFTVLQYNTLYFNSDIKSIAAQILEADADIVGLHEMTSDRWSNLEPLIADKYPHYLSGLDEPLAEIRRFGSVLLSTQPLKNAQAQDRGLTPVAATTELHGRDVLVVALHPSPSRTNQELINNRHELLDATTTLTQRHNGPAIVITDLNIAPTSPEYSAFLDGLAWPDPRRELGIAPTYPAGVLNPIGIAIDHVFASPALTITGYELGDGGGSDHRSLLATVSLEATGWPSPQTRRSAQTTPRHLR